MPFVELYYLPTDTHGFDIDLHNALAYLDQHELTRYHRFKNNHAQQCFLQARRIAKAQLAKKLGCRPGDINFTYTETEKPVLVNSPDWHFNISHSQSAVVVAISDSLVGVDVEDIDRCKNVWQKAETFLNAHVKRCVDKASNADEAAAIFAEHWSCTESYIKLKGSAIYREKDRVKAEKLSVFEGGKHYAYDGVKFSVFDFHPSTRISVATYKETADIEVINWRTGKSTHFCSEAAYT